jgi:large subunit ribosomal protein L31e
MAKKEQKPKVTVEREYIIPLRKEFQKAPSYKRAKKTITAIKEFLTKHMKSDNIKLGKYLNLKVWEHGMKNPPHKVKVKVEKYDDGLVKAELVGAPVEKSKEKKKKPAKKTEEKTIKEDKKQTEEKKETAKKEDKKKPEKKQEEKETVKKKEPENKAEEKKEVKEQESKPAETKEELKKQDNKKEEPKEK